MSPTDISDGPAETKVLTSDEALMVFKQKFSAGNDLECPFESEVRPPFQYLEGRPLFLPIVVRRVVEHQQDTASLYWVAIANHPESTVSLTKKFRELITMSNPFVFSVDGMRFDADPDHDELQDVHFLLSGEDTSAPYLMEGDVALSYDAEKKDLLLHVTARAGFAPPGWFLAGRVLQVELEFLKTTGRLLKTLSSELMAYHKPLDNDFEFNYELMAYHKPLDNDFEFNYEF